MITVNSYGLIRVGLIIRLLRNIEKNDTAKFVLEEIQGLEDELEASELFVSKNSLQLLEEIIERLKELPSDKVIGEEANNITKQMVSIESVVFSEASIKNIYIIPPRRFNSKYLLEEPENLLKAGVFEKLSDIGKFDFTSSCRCLSFGEGTSSAFHILRVTEDTLKTMYFTFKKTNRLEKPMWGPMIDQLRSKRDPKPNATILDTLDIIRKSYRNPTQHPEVIYDIDSAQDLLGLCIDIINKMVATY